MFTQSFGSYLNATYLKYFLNPSLLSSLPPSGFPTPASPTHPAQLYNPLESLQLYTSSGSIYSSSYIGDDTAVDQGEQLYCPYCDFTCDKESSMTRHHEEQHHSSYTVLTCEDCTFTTVYQLEMSEHIMTQHSKLLSCCICNQQFYGKNSLAKHFQNHFHSGQNHLALELAMAEKKTYPKKTSQSFPYQPVPPGPVRTNSQCDNSGCFKIPRPKKSRSMGNEPGWKCPICNFKVCQESLLLDHVQKIHLADTSCALVGIRAISNSYEKSGKQK